jgi:hypothetical protein
MVMSVFYSRVGPFPRGGHDEPLCSGPRISADEMASKIVAAMEGDTMVRAAQQ